MPYDAIDSQRISVARPHRAIRWIGSLALVLASIVVGLLLLEIGCRALQGPQALRHWPNIVLKARI